MRENKKITKLRGLFNKEDKILVAFSGGVDSSFLLYLLTSYTDAQIAAVTIKTPYIPQWELEEAGSFCKSNSIEHFIIEMGIHNSVIMNPEDRCYKCKSVLFTKIKEAADSRGFDIIADGSNADDINDYRPGMRALKEMSIRSPLLECGITKAEIRGFLKESGHEIWNKPAYACLLTRIPHNTRIKIEDLQIIEKAERFLHTEGFPGTRIRLHNNLFRIETNPDNFDRLMNPAKRERIIRNLKKHGIEYITLDLDGYRTGSMNPLKKEKL